MAKRFFISKSTFLKGYQCKKALFFLKHRPDMKPPVSGEQQALFDQGHEVGELAQKLFPGGEDLGVHIPGQFRKNLDETQKLITEGKEVIYEAGFSIDRLHCFLDILVKKEDGYHAFEVKSSTELKEVNLWDAAFQYYVMKRTGLEVKDFHLILLDNTYEREGELDIHKLFKTEPVLDKILDLQGEIDKTVREYFAVLDAGREPEQDIGPHCDDPYECDYKGHCWGHVPKYSVFNIARIGSKAWDLYSKGVVSFDEIPVNYPLNENQWQQVMAEIRNQDHIDPDGIREFVERLNYPLYFLDFETFQSAIPLFDHSRPYQQIPFQYSCHVQMEKGGEVMHREFLAESVGGGRLAVGGESAVGGRQPAVSETKVRNRKSKKDDRQYTLDFPNDSVSEPETRNTQPATRNPDPRPEFIRQLIADAGKEGDILVFNQGFESGILSALARDFPEYEGPLKAIRERLVDLMVPFRERKYYVPAMQGSYSIKKVLPALVPELSYEGMEIAEGGMASLAFKNLSSETDPEVIRKVRENLLAYCKLDTLAMVEILRVLERV